MGTPWASGKRAIGICDRCGRFNKLSQLQFQVVNMRNTNLLVCPSCLDPDQPQLQVGRFPINDPQALQYPRPDPRNDVTDTPQLTDYTMIGAPIFTLFVPVDGVYGTGTVGVVTVTTT